MTRTTFCLAVILIAAAVAGSGCVPFWVHYDAVKKNENYLKMIDGHQAEHEELARKSDKALSDSQRLQIERDRYKELWEKADIAAKKLHAELKDRLAKGVQQSLPAEMAGGEVQITDDGKISIAGDVLFAPGSANLTPKAKAILAKLAPMLKNDFKDAYIRVEGHTDDMPITKESTKRKFPTNWHLSMGRAVSVLQELKNLEVPEKKMYAAGYGEFKPRVPNKSGKKGAKENRRVEIAVVQTK